MPMKRGGFIAGAIMWGAAIALVLLTQVLDVFFGATEAVVSPTSLTTLESILLALVTALLTVIFIRVPRVHLLTQRTIRGAMRGDDRRAPRTLAPLNPAGALAPGETLTLTRERASHDIVRSLISTFIITILVAALGGLATAAYIGRALVDTTTFYPWLTSAAPYLALVLPGIPVLAALALLLTVVVGSLAGRRTTIIADDRGIRAVNAFGRTRFMPWDDIKAVVRASGLLSDPAFEQYTLWGAQHGLILNLAEPSELLLARNAVQSQTAYGSSKEKYRADALRLLATIAARAPVPMRIFPRGFYGNHQLLAALGVGLTQSDLAILPAAPPPFQPDVNQPASPFVQGMWAASGRITLSARNATPLQVLRLVLFILLVIFAVSFGAITTANSAIGLAEIVVFAVALFVFFIAVWAATVLYRQRGYATLPIVMADNVGLRVAQVSTSLLGAGSAVRGVFIPWQRIRAWAVIPPSPRKPNDIVYVVLWDGPTVAWIEHAGARLALPGLQGDAREAYHLAAEGLRTIVATRTGLPLRLLPQPRGWE
jgi:hypothetical protein